MRTGTVAAQTVQEKRFFPSPLSIFPLLSVIALSKLYEGLCSNGKHKLRSATFVTIFLSENVSIGDIYGQKYVDIRT